MESAIEGFCVRGEHRSMLDAYLLSMNQAMCEPTLHNAMYRLGLPGPWVAEVKERVQAIQAKIKLLTASGQI